MVYKLSNGILAVDIADVGFYRGSRFDWTGFITQVTLVQGNHTFCVPESMVPGEGSGGIGLCNEFGISRAMGYEEAPALGWFPKPGVGLLQKQSSHPYAFDKIYPVKPYPVTVEAHGHEVTFSVLPAECSGYSMRLTKKVALSADKLIICYELINNGSRPFETEEYVHNFIGIDGMPIGEDYELRLKGKVTIEEPESPYTSGLLKVSGATISFRKKPQNPFYCKLSGWEAGSEFNWELVHKPSGTGIREYGDFPVSRMALWGGRHVISPEVFLNIYLLPGQSLSWSRSYQFFTSSLR